MLKLTASQKDAVELALELIESGQQEFTCKAIDVAVAMLKAETTGRRWEVHFNELTNPRLKYGLFHGEDTGGLWLPTMLPAKEKKEIRVLALMTFLEACA